MATITFANLEAYKDQIGEITKAVPKMINSSLHEGAAVLADAVQAEVQGLKQLTPEARQGLHDGLGIAHFWQENGSTVTKIGWTGYNRKRTKRWPRGQPNVMIARTTVRGTSWMRADRFTNRAVKKCRQKAINIMETQFDVELQKHIKNK